MDISNVLAFVGGSTVSGVIMWFLNKSERLDKRTDIIIGRLTKDNERLSIELEKKSLANADCEEIKEKSTKIIKQFETEVLKLKNKLIQANLYNNE